MNRRAYLVPALLAGALCMAGCRAAPPEKPQSFYGETKPMADVVAAINARNERLPTLWAKHYFDATIVDEKKQSHSVNGDGALLYRRPDHILLVGTKPIAGRVFEIGATGEEYWLKIVPEVDTMWWGKYEHLGKSCVKQSPIDPSQLMEVLGVSTFNTDFTALPAPVMRFDNDYRVYRFLWVARAADGAPDRYVAVKEVWYDYQTFLPTVVLLFDANGRVVLRALLSKHQPVEVADVPRDQWPQVATSYRLFFPDTGTRMLFDLSDMVPDKNGVPTRKGIVFPGPGPNDAGVSKVIQLDADCDK